MKFFGLKLNTNTRYLFLRGGESPQYRPDTEVNALQMSMQDRAQLPWSTVYRARQLMTEMQQIKAQNPDTYDLLPAYTRRNQELNRLRSVARAEKQRLGDDYETYGLALNDRSRAMTFLRLLKRQAARQSGVMNNNRMMTLDNADIREFGSTNQLPTHMSRGQFALLIADSMGRNLAPPMQKLLLEDQTPLPINVLFEERFQALGGRLPQGEMVNRWNVERIASTQGDDLKYIDHAITQIAQTNERQESALALTRLRYSPELDPNRQTDYIGFAEILAQKHGRTLGERTRTAFRAMEIPGNPTVKSFLSSIQRRVQNPTFDNMIRFMQEFCARKPSTLQDYLLAAEEEGRIDLDSEMKQELSTMYKEYPMTVFVKADRRVQPDGMLQYALQNKERFSHHV